MAVRRALFTACCAFAVQIMPGVAWADTTDRLAKAAETVHSLAAGADKGIPADLLKKAECVIVVPSMKSGAFVLGGEYGRGFATCRTASGWSAPAGIKVEAGSVGFQIGASESEVVMLVMNKKGMDRLLTTQFALGGDATIAAGPVGRNATAKTDAAMTAEILSYSRSRGLFAGVSLEGGTLRQDDSANQDLYGKAIDNRTILTGGVPPPQAKAFLAAIKNF